MKRAYLATGYSYKKKGIVTRLIAKYMHWRRYHRVTKAMAHLLTSTGWNIFSPITHSHPLPRYISARLDTHTFWLNLDFDWIKACDELWVFCQPGWANSHGVQSEISFAMSLDMPIRYINMDYEFSGPQPERFELPK